MPLDVWEAMALEDVMPTGRTKPLLVQCQLGDGENFTRGTFVLKALGLPEFLPHYLVYEFVGHRVADRVGLRAPGCELVDVSEEFVEQNRSTLAQRDISIQPGLAVGVHHISPMTPMVRSPRVRPEHVPAAAAIYCFDLLIQNPDRRVTNPNCGYNSANEIVVFDFDQAFSFLQEGLLGAPPVPWRVGDLPFARQHVFHAALAGASIDWTTVREAVGGLTLPQCQGWLHLIPVEWAPRAERIVEHLDAVAANADAFLAEVRRTLQ